MLLLHFNLLYFILLFNFLHSWCWLYVRSICHLRLRWGFLYRSTTVLLFLCSSSHVLECCPKIDQHRRRRQIAIWNFLLFCALFTFLKRKARARFHSLRSFSNALFNLIFVGRRALQTALHKPRHTHTLRHTQMQAQAQHPTTHILAHTHTPGSHTSSAYKSAVESPKREHEPSASPPHPCSTCHTTWRPPLSCASFSKVDVKCNAIFM